MGEFIERYCKARTEDVTFGDVEAFAKQDVEENQNLEYKGGGFTATPDGKRLIHASGKGKSTPKEAYLDKLARSVAAFANAEGGLLIAGITERERKVRGATVRIVPGSV